MNDFPDSEFSQVEKRNRVGVLLVHGIGMQKPGDTLVAATGALHKWLTRWLASKVWSGAGAEVESVSLATSARDARRAARGKINFSVDGASQGSWIVEESFWADSFNPPPLTRLIAWCARMILWLPMMYLMPRWFDQWRKMDANSPFRVKSDAKNSLNREGSQGARARSHDVAAAAIYVLLLQLPILALVGPLLVVSLILIAAMTIVPFDSFRSLAQSLQRKLSGSLGDSYFFVEDPIVRSAILSCVERDIRSLARKCDSVVVIAHSQGAAVAYEVLARMSLRGTLPTSPLSLMTYGQGIQRLNAIENAFKRPQAWTIFGLIIYCLIAVFYGSAIYGYLGGIKPITAITICTCFMLVAAGILKVAIDNLFRRSFVLPVPWKNLYASHDPVSGGMLSLEFDDRPPEQAKILEPLILRNGYLRDVALFVKSQRQVVNRRSVIRDHTTYWDAQDDFVAQVADELLTRTGTPLPDEDRVQIESGRMRRHFRCGFLSFFRFMIGGTVIAACLSLPILHVVSIWLLSFDSGGFVTKLISLSPDFVPIEAVGAFTIAIGGYSLYYLGNAGWESWTRREVEAYFNHAAPDERRRMPVLFVISWLFALVCIAALALLDWTISWTRPSAWILTLASVVTLAAIVRAALPGAVNRMSSRGGHPKDEDNVGGTIA